jgi:hypothetical protein
VLAAGSEGSTAVSKNITLAQRMAERDCLTVNEAAEDLRIDEASVRRLIRTGRLVAEFDGIWWIQRQALEEVRNRKPGRPPERELTEEEIKEIRRRRLRGEILRTIANDFQITVSRVSLIGLKYQRRKGRQAPKENL